MWIGVSWIVVSLAAILNHALVYIDLLYFSISAPINADHSPYSLEPQNGSYVGSHSAYEHYLFAQKSGYMLPNNQQLKSEYQKQ